MKNILAGITGLFGRRSATKNATGDTTGNVRFVGDDKAEETVVDVIRRMGTDDPNPGEIEPEERLDERLRRFQ